MNIKKNLWKSTVSSRGEDASIFNAYGGNLYPGANKETFNSNLDLLNKRINAIHKELTYWDLYKITTSVNNSSELEGVVAALAPGEACLINTGSFTLQNDSYSRGDVIVKLISNELVKVPSVNNGIYYPAKIEKENELYKLTYYYSTVIPQKQSGPEVGLNQEAEMTRTIVFKDLSEATGAYIYGQYLVISSNEVRFDQVFMNEELVYPVIKFFFYNSTSGSREEIGLDYTVTVENSQWVVTLSNPDSNWYYDETQHDLDTAPLYMQVK